MALTADQKHQILTFVRGVIHNHDSVENQRKAIVQGLQKTIDHYNWVGFYTMQDHDQTLHLKEYAGAHTDHTVIPYGKGICGQVAASGTTFVSQDVTQETNYIACSLDVNSEIVVPIYKGSKLVAQLDIDSHAKAPFTPDEQDFLEKLCSELALLF